MRQIINANAQSKFIGLIESQILVEPKNCKGTNNFESRWFASRVDKNWFSRSSSSTHWKTCELKTAKGATQIRSYCDGPKAPAFADFCCSEEQQVENP